jgi:N-acetylglucosaminyl-diphospho-decaprenol L-rhamnosyltransferase
VHDLAVIVVSYNSARWLPACLSSVLGHAGRAELDVVVVDNSSSDGTRELVERDYPRARVVPSANHGFAHANNRAALTCDARYVLFLNPDTEVVEGDFGRLVAAMDARPGVGLAGVRQIGPDGRLHPSIRRFPNALRAMGDALALERLPLRSALLGERELNPACYERVHPCDWTSGSFMLARREALLSAGLMDERFFIYSEEPDLCRRMKLAGWQVCHLPFMTIVHHAGKAGVKPRLIAQDVYTRLQYARKHFSSPHRAVYMTAVLARHAVRAAAARLEPETAHARREAARSAVRTVLGRTPPPYGAPPPTALAADPGATTGAAAPQLRSLNRAPGERWSAGS